MEVRRRVWCGVAMSAVLLGTLAAPAVGTGAAPTAVPPPDVTSAADDGVAYPRQQPLTEPPADPEDQSYWRGAIPFREIAPLLKELMGTSEYVSAEVVGQSTRGRDLYLVTVTAPDAAEERAQQDAWPECRQHDAGAAQRDA